MALRSRMNGLDRKNGLSFVTIVTKENGEGSRIATPLHFLCKRLTFSISYAACFWCLARNCGLLVYCWVAGLKVQ